MALFLVLAIALCGLYITAYSFVFYNTDVGVMRTMVFMAGICLGIRTGLCLSIMRVLYNIRNFDTYRQQVEAKLARLNISDEVGTSK